jgi:hypothetical protein
MDSEKQTMIENYEQRLHIAQANIQMLASELDEQQEMATQENSSTTSSQIFPVKAVRNSSIGGAEKTAKSPKRNSLLVQTTTRQVVEQQRPPRVSAVSQAAAYEPGSRTEVTRAPLSKREVPAKKAASSKKIHKQAPKPEKKKENASWRKKTDAPLLRALHVRIMHLLNI